MSGMGQTDNDIDLINQVDLAALLEQVQALFPDLRGTCRAALVGEGFGSCAVSIDDRAILRIARNAETMARHWREAAILPLLRDRLPLAIPEPRWFCGPAKVFSLWPRGVSHAGRRPLHAWHGAAGQSGHSGAPAWRVHVGAARVSGGGSSCGRSGTGSAAHALVAAKLLPALPAHLDGESYARFQAWWAGYQAHPERYATTPRLLHGDLWCENILLAPGLSHAVDVVDFEQVRIGDPVSEFAALRYLGDEFVDRVRAHYRPADALEPNFEERLRAAILLRELGGLRYALRYPASGELEDAVEKVRDVLAP